MTGQQISQWDTNQKNLIVNTIQQTRHAKTKEEEKFLHNKIFGTVWFAHQM